jgi:phospholipid/cholesterol/gamma-HCH transport system substrate-binding protein
LRWSTPKFGDPCAHYLRKSGLSAFSQALRGKGEQLGQAITDANDLLLTVNPRMSTIQQDWRLFGKTAAAYSNAAQDILSILDAAVTPSATITANQQALDTLLLSATTV